ncbi:response regulator [Gaoshiqia sediminis]|uniref:Response regulator n=1 Tax=Gaoshiqia sediminis TaxID=2986998 RepID=A0AA41YBE6_9BACT|nr:response regulator [Gaoshiqia sediminis]MCW0482920.1 response regulator [Gaoshiqia sediminis]
MYEEKENPTDPKAGLNILIAEDEEYNYLFLSEVLSDYQVNLTRAYNGKMAVDICAKDTSIQLVLMDIRMPVMDGYQATQLIKQQRPHLPVIAQTAYAMEADRSRALEGGFDDYLSKPLRKADLLKIIDQYAPENCPLREKTPSIVSGREGLE